MTTTTTTRELRVGDTFLAACPGCSPAVPVTHVVRSLSARKGKRTADVLCGRRGCFRPSVGYVADDGTLTVTWLEHTSNDKPALLKVEPVPVLLHDRGWAEKFTPPAVLTRVRREQLLDQIAALLQAKRFTRKRQLEGELATLFPEFAAVNLSARGDIRLAFPEVSGLLKELRMDGRIRFGMSHGHHWFGRGKTVRTTAEQSFRQAWTALDAHRLAAGPIRVSLEFFLPVADADALDHFVQAVYPLTEIGTPFRKVLLECGHRARKRGVMTFKLNAAECTLTLAPRRMTVRVGVLEKGFAASVVKLLLMGNVIAREVCHTARLGHAVLTLNGRPVFPATVLVHNQLPHSDALWKTEFNNLHRAFHGFPQRANGGDRSESGRVLLSHGVTGPTDFPPELVAAHLERFRLEFLREYVDWLGGVDEYVPPSVLRLYAPTGAAADALVQGLTDTYAERLKKAELHRQRHEQRVKGFVARANFWQSLIVLLFSIAAVTELKPLTWALAVLSLLFAGYLFWATVWQKKLKGE
jgi:hypothetical protein